MKDEELLNKVLKITYHSLRPLINVTDKINIVSIILFAYNDNINFADLLYKKNYQNILNILEKNEIFLEIDFNNKNIKECFEETIKILKNEVDKDEYYKHLAERDEYAIACYEIVKIVEIKKEKIDFKKLNQFLNNVYEIRGNLENIKERAEKKTPKK